MADRTLFRGGKAILKVKDNPDGTFLLYKPFAVTTAHIMRITGAPGWDKEHINAVFGELVNGGLRYHAGDLQFDITIEKFREHAFEREDGDYGGQYHCHIKHYDSTGVRKVSPLREERDRPSLPRLTHLSFGDWLPCPKCKGERAKAKDCPNCDGLGFVKWQKS